MNAVVLQKPVEERIIQSKLNDIMLCEGTRLKTQNSHNIMLICKSQLINHFRKAVNNQQH